MADKFDVAIIGTGPAGLTAGVYTGRAKLSTVIFEKENFGGYITNIETIDNFPSRVNIPGNKLSNDMLTQIRQFGTKLTMAEVLSIKTLDDGIAIETNIGNYECKALLIASGAVPRKLNVPGEDEFFGKGVFYCATCDGPQYENKDVVVAGGGDSALTEALNLTRIVREVTIIEIMPELTGTGVIRDKVMNNPQIDILCGVKIEKINGDQRVQSLDLLDIETNSRGSLSIDGILVHVGRKPATDFVKNVVPLTGDGYITVNNQMKTELPSIFAAGDVRQGSPMQIIAACGDGAIAAMSIIKKFQAR